MNLKVILTEKQTIFRKLGKITTLEIKVSYIFRIDIQCSNIRIRIIVNSRLPSTNTLNLIRKNIIIREDRAQIIV